MRGAPPVQMACGPDTRWRVARCLVLAAAAATAVAWTALLYELAAVPVVGLAVTAGALAGLGGWRWPVQSPRLCLAWDGRGWWLDQQPGEVVVMIDLGPWMLLRFFPHSGPACWLPLDVVHSGAPVHLSRAVLHAHAGSVAAPAARALPSDLHG